MNEPDYSQVSQKQRDLGHPATHQNILIEVIYFGLSDALDRKNVEILQR